MPDEDKDKDGFTITNGDCNDCDPNINPDAVDTPPTTSPDGGITEAIDNNCNGKIELDLSCDAGLPLDDVDPQDAAKSIEICQTTTPGKSWGLIGAKYVSADGGSPRSPGLQVGLLQTFGPNVTPRSGAVMLGLSSGHMRIPGQPGFCVDPIDNTTPSQNCANPSSNGPPPQGFPQATPGCASDSTIHDDIALELTLRAPSNVTGYSFAFKYYTFDYPEWVCGPFVDQFVALQSPAPNGAINGNVAFDFTTNPFSANTAFMSCCDPATKDLYSQLGCNKCKQPPLPYCPRGITELQGTGMLNGALDGGGTEWLKTTAPVNAKQEFKLRFAIWDAGDHNVDSHVILDAFTWITTPGVFVGTTPF